MARGNTVKLTDRLVRELDPPTTGNKIVYDSEITGFGIRTTRKGAKSFVLNYYAAGFERRLTIGSYPAWPVAKARGRAKELRREVDNGGDPMATVEPDKTVAEVLDLFVERYAPANLRRPKHYIDAFDRLVKPAIGRIGIPDLKRRHIAEMLDAIEDNNGAVMATRALSYLRSALNWYAARDDEFTVPIVRGMARSSSTDRARDRTLDDDEIRTLWPAFEQVGNFGLACRVMLLTGCRRSEVTGMTWSEIDGDIWTIPASRYKTARDQVIPLPSAVQSIIEAQPRTGPLVFPGKGGVPLSRGGNHKAAIDKLAATLAPWRVHDLRRTSRSLMSRAGVQPDTAERVLGHAIPGIRGVYDRYEFLAEKRDILERLGTLIDRSSTRRPLLLSRCGRRGDDRYRSLPSRLQSRPRRVRGRHH
jgi:integrase